MIEKIKKIGVVIKNSVDRLKVEIKHRIPGYLAYCQDCGHLRELAYFKEAQKFMCRQCIERYVKLYLKMEKNRIDTKNEQKIKQVV